MVVNSSEAWLFYYPVSHLTEMSSIEIACQNELLSEVEFEDLAGTVCFSMWLLVSSDDQKTSNSLNQINMVSIIL